MFTWRFCLLLQVWNYLLLLGICALFKKRALFFLLWIKCWDGWRSFQYGLVKYLLFLLFSVQDFWPLFFPLLSQCWVQHVSTISFVRSFKTTFVPVSSYKNKLDIWLDLQILSFLFFWNWGVGKGKKKGVRSWSFSTDDRACAVFSVDSRGSRSGENSCLGRIREHLHDAKQMLKSCLHLLNLNIMSSISCVGVLRESGRLMLETVNFLIGNYVTFGQLAQFSEDGEMCFALVFLSNPINLTMCCMHLSSLTCFASCMPMQIGRRLTNLSRSWIWATDCVLPCEKHQNVTAATHLLLLLS